MSGSILASVPIKEASIEAVIIRADGRCEPLGTIAYFHRNPLRRLAWRIGRLLKGVI
jgi:hypothetical protein